MVVCCCYSNGTLYDICIYCDILYDLLITAHVFIYMCIYRFATGALFIQNVEGPVSVTRNLFKDSNAENNGGALVVTGLPLSFEAGDLIVTDNRFVRNVAGKQGGAVFTSSINGTTTTQPNKFIKNDPDDVFNG